MLLSFFSSFATVSQRDVTSLDGKFGPSQGCKWQPSKYDQRIYLAKQVAVFKQKLPHHLAERTKRTKVTQFNASKSSRQEFEPLID